MATPTLPAVSTFRLPDLVSYCHRLPPTYHTNGDAIAAASAKWFENGCRNFTDEKRCDLYGLKSGQLTAYCYPNCDDEHMRIVCDYMNILFHLDDLSDGLITKDNEILADIVMNALSFPHSYHPTHANGQEHPEESDVSKLVRNFWARCMQDAGPGVQARFCESLEHFFAGVAKQARERENGLVPDKKSYINVRRADSGTYPLFDLLEYALRIDLPEYVINDPIIKALKGNVNEFVAWSNDIFSYNAEQARGDKHNMVAILMEYEGLNLQDAVDHVGNMCCGTVDAFCENRKKIPSWGPEIDRDVAAYAQGLENWISGSLQWSFMTERYFGPRSVNIKKTLLVELVPKEVQANKG